jgi:hypothetical protein
VNAGHAGAFHESRSSPDQGGKVVDLHPRPGSVVSASGGSTEHVDDITCPILQDEKGSFQPPLMTILDCSHLALKLPGNVSESAA